MSSGRLIQRPLSDGEELKRTEKLKKPGRSTEGRLDPGRRRSRQIRTFVNLRLFAPSVSAGFGRVRKRGFLQHYPGAFDTSFAALTPD